MNAKIKNVLYGVVPRIAAVGLTWWVHGFLNAAILLFVIMAVTNYIDYKIESRG
jgi:hypothetical protein